MPLPLLMVAPIYNGEEGKLHQRVGVEDHGRHGQSILMEEGLPFNQGEVIFEEKWTNMGVVGSYQS